MYVCLCVVNDNNNNNNNNKEFQLLKNCPIELKMKLVCMGLG